MGPGNEATEQQVEPCNVEYKCEATNQFDLGLRVGGLELPWD